MPVSRRTLTLFPRVPPATTPQAPSGLASLEIEMLCTISLLVSVTFAAAVSVHFVATLRKTRRSKRRKGLSRTPSLRSTACLHPNTKVKISQNFLCKSIWCFNKCISYIEIKQFAVNWIEASYIRWSWPVLKNNFPLHRFHPMVQHSVSLFCWLSFIFITTFLFHWHCHFTLISRWASDQSAHWQVFGG